MLEGTLAVRVGEQVHQISAGGVVIVPGGTAHTFWNPRNCPPGGTAARARSGPVRTGTRGPAGSRCRSRASRNSRTGRGCCRSPRLECRGGRGQRHAHDVGHGHRGRGACRRALPARRRDMSVAGRDAGGGRGGCSRRRVRCRRGSRLRCRGARCLASALPPNSGLAPPERAPRQARPRPPPRPAADDSIVAAAGLLIRGVRRRAADSPLAGQRDLFRGGSFGRRPGGRRCGGRRGSRVVGG